MRGVRGIGSSVYQLQALGKFASAGESCWALGLISNCRVCILNAHAVLEHDRRACGVYDIFSSDPPIKVEDRKNTQFALLKHDA
jgi:hypothetical protein